MKGIPAVYLSVVAITLFLLAKGRALGASVHPVGVVVGGACDSAAVCRGGAFVVVAGLLGVGGSLVRVAHMWGVGQDLMAVACIWGLAGVARLLGMVGELVDMTCLCGVVWGLVGVACLLGVVGGGCRL